MGRPWARSDDLRAGTAVACPPPHQVLVTERLEGVLAVPAEVEGATDGGDRAYGYVAYEAAAIDVQPLPTAGPGPVVLTFDPAPVDSREPWLFHTTSRREPYDRRFRRRGQADDVVLVDERGQVTETTRADLAVRLDGRWWTPALRSGCLPGVERERLLDHGRLREGVLVPADLERAEDLAVVSSLRGRRPARLLARTGMPALAGAAHGAGTPRPG